MEDITQEELDIVAKIPVGYYCYGPAIGDKGIVVKEEGRRYRKYTTIGCPYCKDDYCSFVKEYDDLLLPDQVKICNIDKYYKYFPLLDVDGNVREDVK